MPSKLELCVLIIFAAANIANCSTASAGDPDVVSNGGFDTSECAVQNCAPWQLSGSAKIIKGGNSATSEQALGFEAQRELGQAKQQVDIRPGNYQLVFRFFKPCEEGLQTLLVVSVSQKLTFARVFKSDRGCGWEKLSKVIALSEFGKAELLFRVRSLEYGVKGKDFLIDSVELNQLSHKQ